MKICQVHPACGIDVPPKDWGAIEKIVWEFHQNFLKQGHESEIKFATEINPDDFDIVHCHLHPSPIFRWLQAGRHWACKETECET